MTGGNDDNCNPKACVYNLEMKAGLWKQLPDLNVPRFDHSSYAVVSSEQEQVIFVACGEGEDGYLNSVEMLRLDVESWVLINLPDLSPGTNPVLC